MQVLDATTLAERLACEGKEYCLRFESDMPLDKYPAKQHARRVQEKMDIEHGLIYLPGQPARNNEDSDMPAPFRQRRYFYYLSGCNEPNCHLVYDVRRDLLSLFIPRINPERVIWNGRGSTRTEALAKYDVDQVFYSDELQYVVQGWAHGNRHAGIYVLHPSSRVPGCDNLVPRTDFHSLQPAMDLCRMIKDSHEIGLIRKANEISSEAHEKVLENILNFNNEAQVEGIFMDVCISNQAKQQAYNPIAASGPNAGTLHYDANNESLKGRQLMCLDAGCEYELYASDITRTFPLSASWPSKEAERIYKLVERMQEKCIERLAPGVRYLDLHILAHQIAIDGLLQLGILHNGTKEEIYKAGTSRAFFPHGLGHHVGLEVHDPSQADLMSVRRGKLVQQAPSLYPENFHAPVYNSETCRAPADPYSSHLEEGMVVTVEPGIYFSIYALQNFYLPSPIHSKFINVQVLKRYLPVGGVRIEDDILITARGYENLTTAPKGEAMLHIIRQGNSNGLKPLDRRIPPSRRQSYEAEIPMLRAPGIPKEMPQPIPKPLTRALTLPANLRHQQDLDFEPSPGPSLFSNFARSMTTDERMEKWWGKRNVKPATSLSSERTRKIRPVCGDSSSGTQHIYMGEASSIGSLPRTKPEDEGSSACKNCVILVQALDRLRQNLTSSTHSSPVPIAAATTEGCAKDRTVETRRETTNVSTSHKEKVSGGLSTSTPDHRVKEGVYSLPQHSHPNMSSTPAKMPSPARRVQFESLPQDDTHTSKQQPTPFSPPHNRSTTQSKSGSSTMVSPSSLPLNTPQDPNLVASWQTIEVLQKKIENLQLGMSNLEERSRTKTRHPQPGRLPVSRPSMPNLMSHPF